MKDFLDIAISRLTDMPREEFIEKLKEHELNFIALDSLDVFSISYTKESGVILIQSFTPDIKDNCEDFSANEKLYTLSQAA
ncbi:hypothetical protein [Chromobacterium amazonense]|uniref:hypothetical protein n=1 Tax=Chromobacterium amazonense TaxID=1382803 RepID=UPI00237D4D88|nr:hypothetical protein [Chromobacterium amazonense]MDE1712990.1 hypothetical protein [Chromobacterium amazonense]